MLITICSIKRDNDARKKNLAFKKSHIGELGSSRMKM